MDLNIPTIEYLSPSLWGKSAWEFLDMLIITYPKDSPSIEKRDAVHDVFQSLCKLLPCPECKKHFIEYTTKHSVLHALNSRRHLIDFYFNLRREIALRSNKPFRFRNPEELWNHLLIRFQIPRNKPKSNVFNYNPQPQSKPQYKPNIIRYNEVKKHISTCNCSR